MKTAPKLLILLIFLTSIFTENLYSQITFSGDMRFRPRFDVKDNTGSGGEKIRSLYYQYRARIRMKADIGDNWLFQTMVSGNELAYYGRASDSGLNTPSGNSKANQSAGRMDVSFMEMFMGNLGHDHGFKLGLFLMGAYTNPVFDLHFYPALMVDIPFYIFNMDGHYGFTGYYKLGPGKLAGALLVDDNQGIYTEDADGNIISDSDDNHTFYIEYKLPLSKEIILSPMLLIPIIADEGSAAPVTFGGNLTLPRISGLTSSLFAGYSTQNKAEKISLGDKIPGMPNNKYSAWLVRGKIAGELGPGSLLFWMDFGSRVDEFANNITNYFYYHWLSYTFTLHKGEYGAFCVSPEWRMINKKREDETIETRHKIEFRFDIEFR